MAHKPCEFLAVSGGEFVWDRGAARSRFELHLEAESNRGVGRDETPLDGIWRAAESTISDVVAHIPVRSVPQVAAPANATELLESAISAACRELRFPRGHFGNKRRSVQAIGFAYGVLRVHVSIEVASKMLARSRRRLSDAHKRLTVEQAARAVEVARKIKPLWKGPND